MDECKLGVVPLERLKIEVKLLLGANRKSCMPCRMAQQWMTLSDLECLKSTSSSACAIFAVAQLLTINPLKGRSANCLHFAIQV